MPEENIEPREQVIKFLRELQELAIDENHVQVNSGSWADGKINKTRVYMAESGITKSDMCKVISELNIENYCATKPDVNPNFTGEVIREFGIDKNLVDREEHYYIKLKVRKFHEKYLIIMSFHPEQPMFQNQKLKFPYKKQK